MVVLYVYTVFIHITSSLQNENKISINKIHKTDRQTDRRTDGRTDGQADGRTDKQTDRWTDGRTGRGREETDTEM